MPVEFSKGYYDMIRCTHNLFTQAIFAALETSSQQIDQGFKHALQSQRFEMKLPLPWPPRNTDPVDKIRRMHEWNILIDDYISHAQEQGDHRPAAEIERACKIDRRGGPLYTRCGARDCGAIAEVPSYDNKADPAKFLLCGKCMVVAYCSKECQKRAWKDPQQPHKTVCGSVDAMPLLPSQNVLRPLAKSTFGPWAECMPCSVWQEAAAVRG